MINKLTKLTTTEWTAPILAQANIPTTASITIGMQIKTLSPFLIPCFFRTLANLQTNPRSSLYVTLVTSFGSLPSLKKESVSIKKIHFFLDSGTNEQSRYRFWESKVYYWKDYIEIFWQSITLSNKYKMILYFEHKSYIITKMILKNIRNRLDSTAN